MRIAAFDSGIGGLSALLPLIKKFPHLELDYLGDLANLPYGTKSADEIRTLTEKNLSWLLSQNPEWGPWGALIVACGTVTSRAFEVAQSLARQHRAEALGVISPLCQSAISSGKTRVVVMGTPASVAAGQFLLGLKDFGYAGKIDQVPCPRLVELAELGLFDGPEAESTLKGYLEGFHLSSSDVVILGCTHYSYFKSCLERLYPLTAWADAGSGVLQVFSEQLSSSSVPAHSHSRNRVRLRFTGHSPSLELLHKIFKAFSLEFDQISTLETVKPLNGVG